MTAAPEVRTTPEVDAVVDGAGSTTDPLGPGLLAVPVSSAASAVSSVSLRSGSGSDPAALLLLAADAEGSPLDDGVGRPEAVSRRARAFAKRSPSFLLASSLAALLRSSARLQ